MSNRRTCISPVELIAERNLCERCRRRDEREAEGICQFRACSKPEYDTCGLCYGHLIQCVAAVQNIPDPEPRTYEPPPPPPPTTAAVYYVDLNGLVKIGTTINLRRRISSYCVADSHLLAVEPDGRRELFTPAFLEPVAN